MAGKKKKAAAASTRTDSKKSTKKAGKKSVKKVAETPATDRLQRVYAMSFASVYPHYVAKAERKGRSWILNWKNKPTSRPSSPELLA